jgi:mono/diheme cytochrome c family protein
MPTALLAQAAEVSDDATSFSRFGWVLAAVVVIGFAIAVFLNMRKGRAEVGSEIELAANRKPYLSDDELETTKLDRTLGLGLVLIAVVGVSLPLYWLYEPARQEGRVEMYDETFIRRGRQIYDVAAQCASCHGADGVGGSRSTTLLTDNGDFVATVTWQAPALNNVLFRYSYEEVKDILIYGRGNTPMPAWGAEGGGPLTDQQLDDVIAYLESIQISSQESQIAVQDELDKSCAPDEEGICTVNDPASPDGSVRYENEGEAIFNMGLYSGFAGGAYSCGRCHTKGWSYGEPEVTGGGALGPNLTGGSELRQFDTAQAQEEFIARGSEFGRPFGNNGNGSGQMPGYGLNPNAEEPDTKMQFDQVMLTEAQIAAVTAFERRL